MRLNHGSWYRGEHYPNWFDVAVDFTAEGDHRGEITRTFNLPEFLDDMDYWRALVGDDDKPAEVMDLDKIEILDASVFRYDPTPHLAARALQVVCENAAKRLAESRSIEFAGDYFAAQDLHDAVTGRPEAKDVPSMVEAMDNLSRHERGGSPIVTAWDNAWARPLRLILDRRAAAMGNDAEPVAPAAPTI